MIGGGDIALFTSLLSAFLRGSFLLPRREISPFGAGVKPLIGVKPLKDPSTTLTSSSSVTLLVAALNVSGDALKRTPENWV